MRPVGEAPGVRPPPTRDVQPREEPDGKRFELPETDEQEAPREARSGDEEQRADGRSVHGAAPSEGRTARGGRSGSGAEDGSAQRGGRTEGRGVRGGEATVREGAAVREGGEAADKAEGREVSRKPPGREARPPVEAERGEPAKADGKARSGRPAPESDAREALRQALRGGGEGNKASGKGGDEGGKVPAGMEQTAKASAEYAARGSERSGEAAGRPLRDAPVAAAVKKIVKGMMDEVSEGEEDSEALGRIRLATQPVPGAAEATAPPPPAAAVAGAPFVPPPAPVPQMDAVDPRVAEALRNLHEAANGETVVKFSEGSGSFEARIRMEGADLHVRLRADEALRHQRLLDGLNEVRRALDREGLVSGRVHVTAEGAGEGARQGGDPPGEGGRADIASGQVSTGESPESQPSGPRNPGGSQDGRRGGRLHLIA